MILRWALARERETLAFSSMANIPVRICVLKQIYVGTTLFYVFMFLYEAVHNARLGERAKVAEAVVVG
jgi:hypothetical protein